MIINLTPVRMGDHLSVDVNGKDLLINEEVFDFSRLQDGDTLPREAIASHWFSGDVKRVDGVLHVTLVFPHGPHADEAARFPVPITVTQDGPVQLPDSGHDAPESPPLPEPVAEDAA